MDAGINHESWALGYRAAVCDLIPVPVPDKQPEPARNSGVFFAYLIGIMVGIVLIKFTQE